MSLSGGSVHWTQEAPQINSQSRKTKSHHSLNRVFGRRHFLQPHKQLINQGFGPVFFYLAHSHPFNDLIRISGQETQQNDGEKKTMNIKIIPDRGSNRWQNPQNGALLGMKPSEKWCSHKRTWSPLKGAPITPMAMRQEVFRKDHRGFLFDITIPSRRLNPQHPKGNQVSGISSYCVRI